MEKRGLVGWIILIVIIAILLIAAVAAFYFYNFHVFETVRVCVGEATDTSAPCENVQNCVDLAEENGISVDLSDAPDFIRENFDAVLDEAVYCDGTCFVKNVRGIDPDTQELEMLESCEDDEVEFAVDIRGKEGLEVLEWMKARNA
tara:strand:- start:1902 stop:2339 length:438 start_codon:yes stop_codon:yes gene_type:complete